MSKPASQALPSAEIIKLPLSTKDPEERPRNRGLFLTKATVGKLALPIGKTDVIFFDGQLPNFGLRIRAGGKKTYIAQYRDEHGSTRRVTIGSTAALEPDKARAAAKRILGEVVTGNDPAKRRREARGQTKFGELVPGYLQYAEQKQRPLTFRETKRNLAKYCISLTMTPVQAIDRATIAQLHDRITAKSGPVQGNRVLATISSMIGWAMGKGYVEHNAAIGVPKNPETPRSRVLTDAELKALWNATANLSDYDRIVRLLMLTGCRKSEIGNADWSEIDGPTLSISGKRMKNGDSHRVHLTELALEQLPGRRDGKVFGTAGTGFGGWSKGKERLYRRSGIKDWGLHDLRRTVSTRLHDAGVAPHHIEAVLAHLSGHRSGVAGTYNHAAYEQPKIDALHLWSGIVSRIAEL